MAAAASGGTPDRRRRCRQDRSSSRRCGLIIVAMVAACAYVRPGGVRCHLASLKRRCSAVETSTCLDPLHDRQARAPIHTTAPRSIHSTELDMELRPRGGAPTWIRFDRSIDRIDIDPAPLAKTQNVLAEPSCFATVNRLLRSRLRGHPEAARFCGSAARIQRCRAAGSKGTRSAKQIDRFVNI